MTYSIGMRAPSLAELKAGAARLFDDLDDVTANSSATGADVFYEDPDLTTNEAVPGLISDAAIRRAGNILRKSTSLDRQRIAMILGCVATDPKAWLAPERVSDDEAKKLISQMDQKSNLCVHGMARIAFCETGATCMIFANGHARQVSPGALPLFQNICKFRAIQGAALCADNQSELLRWLLTSGVFDLSQAPG